MQFGASRVAIEPDSRISPGLEDPYDFVGAVLPLR